VGIPNARIPGAAAVLWLAASRALADADAFQLFPEPESDVLVSPRPEGALLPAMPAELFYGPPGGGGFDLGLTFPKERPPPSAPSVSFDAEATASRPRIWLTGLVSLGALAGAAANSYRGGGFSDFHVTAEGFFGSQTYAGGVDKASHFVDHFLAARALAMVYGWLGYSPSKANLLGFSVATLAGLVTEVGDGTTAFGFSWEDMLADALGAGAALGLSASGWDDTIGFRQGFLDQTEVPACCVVDASIGRDYSGEIYTMDWKLSGLSRRLHASFGPARFLLFSLTYGTSGYRFAPPELRQRLVGFEVGVHFGEVLRALRVPERTWWGEVIYFVFDSIRFPYTAVGFRYDLNNGKWYGPTAGKVSLPR
jgi:hypothetical protein